MRNKCRRVTLEDLKIYDKYLGPQGKGISREAMFDMMQARGLGNDGIEVTLAAYNNARKGKMAKVLGNKKCSELVKNHLMDVFGDSTDDNAPMEGQMTMEEALMGVDDSGMFKGTRGQRIAEEELEKAPERPDMDCVLVAVNRKDYEMLTKIAVLMDLSEGKVVGKMIRKTYRRIMTDLGMTLGFDMGYEVRPADSIREDEGDD